jgi:hypothetical protein
MNRLRIFSRSPWQSYRFLELSRPLLISVVYCPPSQDHSPPYPNFSAIHAKCHLRFQSKREPPFQCKKCRNPMANRIKDRHIVMPTRRRAALLTALHTTPSKRNLPMVTSESDSASETFFQKKLIIPSLFMDLWTMRQSIVRSGSD